MELRSLLQLLDGDNCMLCPSGLTVCYVGSAPWILNASLQENVLFGQPLEKKRSEYFNFVFHSSART